MMKSRTLRQLRQVAVVYDGARAVATVAHNVGSGRLSTHVRDAIGHADVAGRHVLPQEPDSNAMT